MLLKELYNHAANKSRLKLDLISVQDFKINFAVPFFDDYSNRQHQKQRIQKTLSDKRIMQNAQKMCIVYFLFVVGFVGAENMLFSGEILDY